MTGLQASDSVLNRICFQTFRSKFCGYFVQTRFSSEVADVLVVHLGRLDHSDEPDGILVNLTEQPEADELGISVSSQQSSTMI